MSVNIRYPNITGLSEKEQLAQIKSYLYQLVDQLNYALPNLGGSTQTYEVQGEEVSYYELRSLIISTTGELRDQYEKLYQRLESDYTSKKEFNEMANAVDAELDRLSELANSLNTSIGDLEAEDVAIKKSIGDLTTVVNAIKTTADGLKTTLEGLNTTVEGVKTKVEELDNSMKRIIDFVSEAGTSGGWTYKKWNGGTFELFGTFTLTTTSDPTAVGSMFCSESFKIPAPFAINSVVVTGSTDGMFLFTNGGTDGGNNISFALLRPNTFGTGTNVVVKLHVVGTYNPGGIE